jgi:hypothetical protein
MHTSLRVREIIYRIICDSKCCGPLWTRTTEYSFLMNSVAFNLGASGKRGVSFGEFKPGGLHEKRAVMTRISGFVSEFIWRAWKMKKTCVQVVFLLLPIADLTDSTLDAMKSSLCSDQYVR